jgi:4-hydroxybenzoyl-CoA thioesterase
MFLADLRGSQGPVYAGPAGAEGAVRDAFARIADFTSISPRSTSMSQFANNPFDSSNLYRQRRKVRFSHCDPAGMVFFPRYLTQLNDLVEDWFDEALGIRYVDFITTRGFGLPTVRLECDFVSPGAFGSEIEWRLSVTRIGASSIGLQIDGVDGADGETPRFRLRSVLVATAVHQGTSIALPDDLRAALLRFRGEAA